MRMRRRSYGRLTESTEEPIKLNIGWCDEDGEKYPVYHKYPQQS